MGAVQVAARAGRSGRPLLIAARSAFIDGMGTALLVGLAFVIAGALVALLFLPSRPDLEAESKAEPATVEALDLSG
ncbi:MAG TPA: hypothetical protein VEQ37_21490 [Actinomycetota bacterium]|nr:hypothetical protein [Actinomycetota bacterium]